MSLAPLAIASRNRKLAKVVMRVYRGANLTDALLASGIPRPSWYALLNAQTGSWPDGAKPSPSEMETAARLRHAIERAQGLFAVKQQQLLASAARMKVGEVDWRAAHEHLKHAEATRTRWREHKEVRIEQVGQVAIEHRIARTLEAPQLLEVCSPEIAALMAPEPER